MKSPLSGRQQRPQILIHGMQRASAVSCVFGQPIVFQHQTMRKMRA